MPAGEPSLWRNRRLLLFVATAALLMWLVWRHRHALAPFLVALALGYVLAPLVDRLEGWLARRVGGRRAARPMAILIVYGTFLATVAGAVLLITPPLVNQASLLIESGPEYYNRLEQQLIALNARAAAVLPPDVIARLDASVRTTDFQAVATRLLAWLWSGVATTFDAVSTTIGWLIAFLIVPIWLFYVLNDTERVIDAAVRLVPLELRADVEAVRIICDAVLGAYVRGQLLVAVLLGVMFTIGLMIVGVPYALLLGFLAGALAIIPYLGTFLGAAPAVLVAAFGGWGLLIKTALVFVVIQQVDNWFISPRVQGQSVALHPGLIMVVLVLGQQIWGPIGLLVAVPIAAIARDVVHYAYLRVGEDRPDPVTALVAVGHGDQVSPLLRSDAAARPA